MMVMGHRQLLTVVMGCLGIVDGGDVMVISGGENAYAS